jgi:hypothetical protein
LFLFSVLPVRLGLLSGALAGLFLPFCNFFPSLSPIFGMTAALWNAGKIYFSPPP